MTLNSKVGCRPCGGFALPNIAEPFSCPTTAPEAGEHLQGLPCSPGAGVPGALGPVPIAAAGSGAARGACCVLEMFGWFLRSR